MIVYGVIWGIFAFLYNRVLGNVTESGLEGLQLSFPAIMYGIFRK